jgi:hypothetical protein
MSLSVLFYFLWWWRFFLKKVAFSLSEKKYDVSLQCKMNHWTSSLMMKKPDYNHYMRWVTRRNGAVSPP